MKKFKFTLLTASIMLAVAFTLSCSSDGGDEDDKNGSTPSSSSIDSSNSSSSSSDNGTSSGDDSSWLPCDEANETIRNCMEENYGNIFDADDYCIIEYNICNGVTNRSECRSHYESEGCDISAGFDEFYMGQAGYMQTCDEIAEEIRSCIEHDYSYDSCIGDDDHGICYVGISRCETYYQDKGCPLRETFESISNGEL